jgi:hypothetical protein
VFCFAAVLGIETKILLLQDDYTNKANRDYILTRLLRLTLRKYVLSVPTKGGPQVRVSSPVPKNNNMSS